MKIYSDCYMSDLTYETIASNHNIEIPKLVSRSLAYIDIETKQLAFFGTARVGIKTYTTCKDFASKIIDLYFKDINNKKGIKY